MGLAPMRMVIVSLRARWFVRARLVFVARRVHFGAVETAGTATSHQKPPASVEAIGSVSITIAWVVFDRRAALNAASSSAIEATLTASAPSERAWATKSIVGQDFVPRVLQEIVERRPARRMLQPVDAAEAAIVEHDDDELLAQHHRGRDLRVHHQIGAVADRHDDLAVGQGHLDADRAGDLVAHAGIAVFDVIAERRAGSP